MSSPVSATNALTVLTELHAISARQAIISTQLGELIEASTMQDSGNLIERLSELFQPLFDDMAEIRRLSQKVVDRGRVAP